MARLTAEVGSDKKQAGRVIPRFFYCYLSIHLGVYGEPSESGTQWVRSEAPFAFVR